MELLQKTSFRRKSAINSLLRLHQDYPGARASVFTTIGDMDADLIRDPRALGGLGLPPIDDLLPALRCRGDPGDSPGADAGRALPPGVISAEMLDHIVEHTMESGDVRVGLDRMKRAVMSAERAARTGVTREDVMSAYEEAKHLHLACTVRALSTGEQQLLRRIAELSREQTEPLTSWAVYAEVKDASKIGYTAFFKRLQKIDSLRLVDLIRVQSGGRSSEIVLRYEPEKVREVCG